MKEQWNVNVKEKVKEMKWNRREVDGERKVKEKQRNVRRSVGKLKKSERWRKSEGAVSDKAGKVKEQWMVKENWNSLSLSLSLSRSLCSMTKWAKTTKKRPKNGFNENDQKRRCGEYIYIWGADPVNNMSEFCICFLMFVSFFVLCIFSLCFLLYLSGLTPRAWTPHHDLGGSARARLRPRPMSDHTAAGLNLANPIAPRINVGILYLFLDDCLIFCALHVFVMFFHVFERLIDILGAYFLFWVQCLHFGCWFWMLDACFVVGFFSYISFFLYKQAAFKFKTMFYLCI